MLGVLVPVTFVAVTIIVAVAITVVGVPEITPVLVFNVTPAGRLPEVIA